VRASDLFACLAPISQCAVKKRTQKLGRTMVEVLDDLDFEGF
jgi:hypothetical protein